METLKLEYDSISPITGNLCVLEEADENTNTVSYICMESGYASNERLYDGSQVQQAYELGCTELMKSMVVVDEDNRAWYPSFFSFPSGMLYIHGTSKDDCKWCVARIVAIPEDEQKNYPIPGMEDAYYATKLDVENATQFDKDDFSSALDLLYEDLQKFYDEDQLRDNSME